MKFGSSGFAKLGWLKMLKNSARNIKFTCSVMAVLLNTAKLNSLNGGPTSTLRFKSPKCRLPARQLLSPNADVAVVLPKVHGTWKLVRFRKLKGALPY